MTVKISTWSQIWTLEQVCRKWAQNCCLKEPRKRVQTWSREWKILREYLLTIKESIWWSLENLEIRPKTKWSHSSRLASHSWFSLDLMKDFITKNHLMISLSSNENSHIKTNKTLSIKAKIHFLKSLLLDWSVSGQILDK